MHYQDNQGSLKLRILFIFLFLSILGIFLYFAVIPGGKVRYIYDFCEKDCNSIMSKGQNFFISKITPDTRVSKIEKGSQKIIGQPAYFNLHTPRRFNKATVNLKYRFSNQSQKCLEAGVAAPNCLPILEIGALADKTIWRYDLEPLQNKVIDELAKEWDMLEEDGVILLQKKKKFYSPKEFIYDLPNPQEVALYNYDLKQEYIIDEYKPSAQEKTIEYGLRGAYQFYTYLKDESLDYGFIFYDKNENKDSDPIHINLYYGDKLIDGRKLSDDGNTLDNGKPSGEREIEFKLVNMPEGIYKIELKVNDDIVTKKITTTQTKIAFLNKIRIANLDKANIPLYTDGKSIKALTTNPGKLQTIQVGGAELKLDETYKQYSLRTEGGLTRIDLSKDDIILAGDGVFSFSREAVINPNFKKIDENLDLEKDGINYVLARYSIPEETQDGWKTASAEFDLTKATQEKGSFLLGMLGGGDYSFLISAPGLLAEDDIDDYLEIDEISADLEGKALGDIFKKK